MLKPNAAGMLDGLESCTDYRSVRTPLREIASFNEEHRPTNYTIRNRDEEDFYLPQTRYYGSKRRLAHWIMGELKNYNFTTAIDIFGGTSTISLALKHLGKKVTYNDILESNRTIAMALLSNQPSHISHSGLAEFIESVSPKKGFIYETYKGIYYNDFENSWLDGAVQALSGVREEQKKAEILYCLMQACLQKRPFNLFHRKNLHIRENNNKDTKFGNWATWEKPFSLLMERALSELHKTRWCSDHDPIILSCTDAGEIEEGYDLVYLDPPYVPINKRDISYMDRYHFLEGLCAPDTWGSKVDRSRLNQPIPTPECMLKWTDKKLFKDSLFDLITKHRRSIVCLSYIHDAFPSIEEIRSFFCTQFKETLVMEHAMPHALSKKSKKEVLIIGRPK